MKSIIFSMLFLGLTAQAQVSIKINQLSCSGLGMAAGYTTINLVNSNKVSITSVKYFVTTTDTNVTITDKSILANGQVRLDMYSTKFGSSFALIMSGPVGPAQLIMSVGTDVLNCQSNITANN